TGGGDARHQPEDAPQQTQPDQGRRKTGLMRIGLRTKQVLGVLALVGTAIAVLFVWYFASLTHVLLDTSREQARLLSNIAYQRIFNLLTSGGNVDTLNADEGLHTILQSYAFSEGVQFAVVCDASGTIVAEADSPRVGQKLDAFPGLDELIDSAGLTARLRAIWSPGTFEVRQSIKVGTADLTIRVGVSTLLVRSKLQERLAAPLIAAAVVLVVSSLAAALLAGLVLRPIHVLRGGLARLGRGEVDVKVDLPADAEFTDLGASFNQLTARLAADRTERAGQRALESIVDRLEDAVALFGTDGTLLFANATMKLALSINDEAPDPGTAPKLDQLLPEHHPYRVAVERALADGTTMSAPMHVSDFGERLVLTNVVPGAAGQTMGVLLVSRNLAYLSQVESTLSYSRKLSALNRLTAGIAHEIKNPLNATMIHLELLKMQVADRPDAMASAGVIADQVRRLDEVVQGFLKFSRPEDLHLEAVDLGGIMESLRPVLDAEAGTHAVEVAVDVPRDLPAVEGDANLLEQAFLNLAL